MSPENQFLRPPSPEPSAQSYIEVVNAVTVLLREQRHFDRDTFTKFKKLFDDSHLKWWIIAAGVGGIVELLRAIVDLWKTH
jgi:hypothetical protein